MRDDGFRILPPLPAYAIAFIGLLGMLAVGVIDYATGSCAWARSTTCP